MSLKSIEVSGLPNCIIRKQVINEELYNIPDCFLANAKYIPEQALDIENEKNLQFLHEPLPIYLINGHGLVVSNITLAPPSDMSKKEANNIRAFEFSFQLKHGFSINSADEEFDVMDNFFTLPENTFVVDALPIGYNGSCDDEILEQFLKENAQDDFKSLRRTLLSSQGTRLFSQIDSTIKNTFIPPGYSAVNKGFWFYDDIKSQKSKDKWGIYKLDDNFNKNIGDIFHKQTKTINTNKDKVEALHPNTELKALIHEDIEKHQGIYLSEIIDHLGPGIYIDVGCSALNLKIFEKTKSSNEPDIYSYLSEEMAQDETLYALNNILFEDYSELTRNTMLAWDNIFSQQTQKPSSYDKLVDDSKLEMQTPEDHYVRKYLDEEAEEIMEGKKVDMANQIPAHWLDNGVMQSLINRRMGLRKHHPNLLIQTPQHSLTPQELKIVIDKFGKEVAKQFFGKNYTNVDYNYDKENGIFSLDTKTGSQALVGGRKKIKRKNKTKKHKKKQRKRKYRKKNIKRKKTRRNKIKK